MKKYMTPSRFTPFYVEHKKREGSLAVTPKRVMELSEEDIAAIRKMSPNVAAQLKPLPEPVKRQLPPKLDELEELVALSEEMGGYDELEDQDD